MDSGSIHELAEIDSENFWFRAKQRYLDQVIRKPGGTILDVGCGAGGNVVHFLDRGFRVVGIDRSELAVRYGAERGLEVVRHDFESGAGLELDFTPDYITILDFLEHLRDPVAVLRELLSSAGAHTRAIVSVPAYPCLWSEWDEAMQHVKRYRRGVLKSELETAGWTVDRIGYTHFLPLLPALLVRKVGYPLVKRFRPVRNDTFFNPGGWLNEVLFQLYKPELWAYRRGLRLPWGLSVFALATPGAIADDGGSR